MSPSDAFARASRRARAGCAARSRILHSFAGALDVQAGEITISQASLNALASVLMMLASRVELGALRVRSSSPHRTTASIRLLCVGRNDQDRNSGDNRRGSLILQPRRDAAPSAP